MASYLRELDRHWRTGEMSADQRERYRLLLRKLKDALPIFEQLNLYRPLVPLDP